MHTHCLLHVQAGTGQSGSGACPTGRVWNRTWRMEPACASSALAAARNTRSLCSSLRRQSEPEVRQHSVAF